MRRAIRKHLRDFAAIVALAALAAAVGGYVLAHQRLRFPWEGAPFRINAEFATAQAGIERQERHGLNVVGIGAVYRHRGAQPARIEQPQCDRLLQPRKDLPGAAGQRVDVAARQIDMQVRQPRIGEHVDADDDGQHRNDTDDRGPDTSAHVSRSSDGQR